MTDPEGGGRNNPLFIFFCKSTKGYNVNINETFSMEMYGSMPLGDEEL